MWSDVFIALASALGAALGSGIVALLLHRAQQRAEIRRDNEQAFREATGILTTAPYRYPHPSSVQVISLLNWGSEDQRRLRVMDHMQLLSRTAHSRITPVEFVSWADTASVIANAMDDERHFIEYSKRVTSQHVIPPAMIVPEGSRQFCAVCKSVSRGLFSRMEDEACRLLTYIPLPLLSNCLRKRQNSRRCWACRYRYDHFLRRVEKQPPDSG